MLKKVWKESAPSWGFFVKGNPKKEGFGIVFIEALACGLPVICSDGYGCKEGLLNGELGSFVNPDDPNSIAKEIISSLKTYDAGNKIKRYKIRKKTLDVYGFQSWDRNVSNFIDLIKAN